MILRLDGGARSVVGEISDDSLAASSDFGAAVACTDDVIANGTLADNNGDGTPEACQCVEDLSRDGAVGAPDLSRLLSRWDPCN